MSQCVTVCIAKQRARRYLITSMLAKTHDQISLFFIFYCFRFFFPAFIWFMRYRGTAFMTCYTVLQMHWMLLMMGISHTHSVLTWFVQKDLQWIFVRGRSLDLCCDDWTKGSVYLTTVSSCDKPMPCHCTRVFMFECVYWYKTHSYLWNSNVYIALNTNPYICNLFTTSRVYICPPSVWSCQVVMLESVI